MCLFVCAVDTGVNEGEPVGEFAEQYRKPEPEEPYREKEIPEGFEEGKFNLILWLHILTQFYKHNLLACFTKIAYALKIWLDSHPLICYNHSLTT